jgi:hypothetical protein
VNRRLLATAFKRRESRLYGGSSLQSSGRDITLYLFVEATIKGKRFGV